MLSSAFFLAFAASVTALPKRNPISVVQRTGDDAVVFKAGNVSYVANTKHPKASFRASKAEATGWNLLVTVIDANSTTITAEFLKTALAKYEEDDDVFSTDFTDSIYISSSSAVQFDASASDYLAGLEVKNVWVDEGCFVPSGASTIQLVNGTSAPPGPYLASIEGGTVSLATVYRLYTDTYRDFLYGTYESNDGNGSYTSLDVAYPDFGYSAIPVPSRIYSWADSRPFAGFRVAIKDLFDMKGLKTSGGSQAWSYIVEPANQTAPSIQRIIDLGGVLVGKYKLAQFASGANPWEWQDEHYPFNPRGDGWLTCSASSSGGGCSIAAYDWLDYAIGSDTGSSMRRPAAVSGTYGQRPSQGLISLERVMPLGAATDTAGVFSRDPYQWVYFSKHWYTSELFQPPNITGLSPLSVPDTDAFPKTILLPSEYLPLNNSAAQLILDDFIANLSTIFGMTVKNFNFTETAISASDPKVANLTYLTDVTLGVINRRTQWEEVAHPLITRWAELFDGRFPPIDPARRPGWVGYNSTAYSLASYTRALAEKKAAVDWYETALQYSTPESCSESVMLGDIGTGGLPSYREEDLNSNVNASFLATIPENAMISWANICPIYGCADFTIPIGQVPYYSQITYREEMVPVTISMVVKRGCDFVLYNMIEKLADAGVLKAVKTGRTAY